MTRQRPQPHKQIYPLRIFGMALGGLAIGGVLYEQQASWMYWALMVLSCLVWPHLAWLMARSRSDPYRAEKCNLLIDSAIAGAWVPLMHFCLLPSVVLVVVTTFDKLSTGMKRLWLYSLPGLLGTGLLFTLLLRPTPRLEGSLLVVLCALPLLVVHTFAVSAASYRLIRTVSRQNRQLEELRRLDALSGLYSRSYWQEQAAEALRVHQAGGAPAFLLMVDIDHFKPVNDLHGHAVGDEVIRAVGRIIRDSVHAEDCAGRYGGDEFVVLCRGRQPADAWAVAQRIREQVGAWRLRYLPQLRLSASIGVAAAGPAQRNLLEWMNDADAALYRAKHEGRDRVAGDLPEAGAVHRPATRSAVAVEA